MKKQALVALPHHDEVSSGGETSSSSHRNNNNNASSATAASSSSSGDNKKEPGSNSTFTLKDFPFEMQLFVFTYLRANDLACLQQTCRLYHADPNGLIHSIVAHTAEHTYPHELTRGFEQEPVLSPSTTNNKNSGSSSSGNDEESAFRYTLQHLRNMELLVMVRALSRPEPKSIGNNFYVSKSWCRTALRWLEIQQEQREERWQQQQQQQQQQLASNNRKQNKHNNNKTKTKKLSKKQQRLRQRKLSDAMPPWSNVNSDLLCPHEKLQHCNSKGTRARRRLMDKQAWKCLKKLYPDSTQLLSLEGECLQCRLEKETMKKNQQDLIDQEKTKRKQPLADPVVRRFYTRTRGVPLHCCSHNSSNNNNNNNDNDNDKKKDSSSSSGSSNKGGRCPLVPGIYYIIPRAWCHSWRKYIKTGEGGPIPAPDASGLLCHAHRLSLLPPHLEAYLYGESSHLFLASSINTNTDNSSNYCCPIATTASGTHDDDYEPQRAVVPVGQWGNNSMNDNNSNNSAVFQELVATGIMPLHEVASQQTAMMNLQLRQEEMNRRQRRREQQQGQGIPTRAAAAAPNEAAAAAPPPTTAPNGGETNNERLDRENHVCVEIVTQEEWNALEKLFPHSSFGLSFAVTTSLDDDDSDEITFSTLPCRDCDPSGLASNNAVTIRNRRKRWLKKVTDNKAARSPSTKVEY